MTGIYLDTISITLTAVALALAALVISLTRSARRDVRAPNIHGRCQPSTKGSWVGLTRQQWRWRQFRFDTLLTVPEIFLTTLNNTDEKANDGKKNDKLELFPDALNARKLTRIIATYGQNRNISWLPFLERLRQNEGDLIAHGCYKNPNNESHSSDGNVSVLVGPNVRLREMSWDSVLPAINGPFAITTVSDIAIMVRRLGMVWEVFAPELGNMRAVGNNQGIFSTYSNSTGLVLHYTRLDTEHDKSPLKTIPGQDTKGLAITQPYIPAREADMMGFGILPGCHRLGVPALKIGTIDEIYTTMNMLDPTKKAYRKLRDIRHLLLGKWDAHCTYGFPDIIALAAPMIRRRRSTVIHIPAPAEFNFSLLAQKEGFAVFGKRLKAYIDESGHASKDAMCHPREILSRYYELAYSEWESGSNHLTDHDGNPRSLAFLEQVHGNWEWATAYLEKLAVSNDMEQLQYFDLMAVHVSHAVNYWDQAWTNIKNGKAHDYNSGLDTLCVEGMHLYFDWLPDMVSDMRERGFTGSDSVVCDAWFTMIFRAFCWWRCHSLGEAQEKVEYKARVIGSRYWGCKVPVCVG